MEQLSCKADIEALYTLHGPTTVTVRNALVHVARAAHESA